MAAAQTFIAGFAGAAGLAIGVLVSSAAREELADGKRWFQLFRNILFLFCVGLFLYQYGITILLVGLVFGTLVMRHFHREKAGAIVLLTFIMLILTVGVPLFKAIAGVFLLIGMLEGGVWAAEHEKVLRRGVFRKKTWRALLADEPFFFLLPFSGVVFLV
ncbi:hypothetical protein JXA12_05185 [Candidatus Woesearchaeota archaeon]|nr:hypothetical protein [Candidatus Woesearchaeota archaeon]